MRSGLPKLDLDWETTEPCPIRLVDEHAFEDDTVTPQELSSRYPTAPNGTQKRARTATHPTKECSVFWNVKG